MSIAVPLPNDVSEELLQAVIDALSAHIAILDKDGNIVAVNRAWCAFADANHGKLPHYGVGLNYIELCAPHHAVTLVDTKAAEDYSFGIRAVRGILDVLRGRAADFQLTYPCHSTTEQRWFLLRVTPLQIHGEQGVVAAHENITTIKQHEEAVTAALVGTVEAIADIVEVRDPYTAGHQKGVARLASAIARQMGEEGEFVRGVHLGALIHDIGKIAIPAEILARPGELTKVERQLIETHCQQGYDMIAGIPFPWPLADIVLQHHERMDGSGYPNGLKGDQINRASHIVAIADVVDAISSHRPYRPSLGVAVANEEMQRGAGSVYDAEVIEAYLSPEVQALVNEMYDDV